MKRLIAVLVPIIALAVPLGMTTGCKTFGATPGAPTKIESAIFTIHTNYIEQIVTRTNLVNLTNEAGIVTPAPVIVTVTNIIPQYALTPGTSASDVATTAGGILNLFVPGGGGLLTSGILALLAAWGHMRSTKSTTTAAALAQEIEALRQFIVTLPDGTKIDQAVVSFLQSHQVEAGVAKQVLDLLNNNVSNTEAKGAVVELKAALDTLSKPAAPA